MANSFYGAIGTTGGATGDLDKIDGSSLVEADGAILIDDNRSSGLYSLDATSSLGEKSPSTIVPDSNAGTKEWILLTSLVAGLKLYESDSTNLFDISMTSGNVLIDNTVSSGTITFQGEFSGNKTMLVLNPAGSTELYNIGTKKLETSTTGVTISGHLTVNDIILGDGDDIIFGVGPDARLTSNGTNFRIKSGDDSEVFIDTTFNGAVTLYFNNVIKTATTSDGLQVEGALALQEITTPSADVNYGKIYTKTDNKLYFQDGAGSEHEVAFV